MDGDGDGDGATSGRLAPTASAPRDLGAGPRAGTHADRRRSRHRRRSPRTRRAPNRPRARRGPSGRRRAPSRRAGAERRGRTDERGLRDLVGSGPSQLGVSGALRGRDVNRPTPEDIAEAERDLEIVRRNWQPSDKH